MLSNCSSTMYMEVNIGPLKSNIIHKMNFVDIYRLQMTLSTKSTHREQNDRMSREIIHHILHRPPCSPVSRSRNMLIADDERDEADIK